MEKDKLKEILELHRKWFCGEKGGIPANLRSADLSSANLRSADLSSADLRSANLRSADLSYANLSSADLSDADLSYANLRSADLRSADLSGADLRSADLRSADLRSADLSSADLRGANLQNTIYAVAVILRAFWCLPTDAKYLTLELMAHDAESCSIEAMDIWASGQGNCPFEHSERDFYFREDRGLWLSASPEDKIPKLRGRKLLEALCEACKVKL